MSDPVEGIKDPVEGITTYCIEYAKQFSNCEECDKPIPHKSLRAGSIFRKKAIQPYQKRQDITDQRRVQLVIEQGLNASWLTVKPVTTAEKEEGEEEGEKPAAKKQKPEEDVDMTGGLTGVQTVQTKTKKVTSKTVKKAVEKKIKETKESKKDKKKVTKKAIPAKAIITTLPSLQDQQELESITKEIQASLQK
ncbi:hypothetical protein DFQ28_009180 [Apophysomyces sp. BC1034]|nr:hypothetical protein DFQ29_007873 [Apophysomyces sp. BC1021]KAG0185542.1 hypothetical protein DFQ28_009180 [Apophysomyces sp. BC1034]